MYRVSKINGKVRYDEWQARSTLFKKMIEQTYSQREKRMGKLVIITWFLIQNVESIRRTNFWWKWFIKAIYKIWTRTNSTYYIVFVVFNQQMKIILQYLLLAFYWKVCCVANCWFGTVMCKCVVCVLVLIGWLVFVVVVVLPFTVFVVVVLLPKNGIYWATDWKKFPGK